MIQNEETLTDNHPDQPAGSESSPPDDTSPIPGAARPSSPFAEWAHLAQPTPPPPPAAAPTPAGQPSQIRPPAPPGPPPTGQHASTDRALHQPSYGYHAPAAPPPRFPPAPPGLYPAPDDPLISTDFNGWWKRSFRLLKAVWRHAALVQLLWAGGLLVSGALVIVLMSPTFTELTNTPANGQPDWRPLVRSLYYLIPISLLIGLIGLLSSLATLHLVVQAAVGRPLSVRHALRTAGPRIPAYIGWGLIGGLLSLVGFVCCILPGYYVTTVMLILPTVVLLERGRAATRCFQLFHARPGDALARLATMIGIAIAIGIVQQVFVTSVAAMFGLFSTDGITWPTLVAISTITVVFSAASNIVIAPMHVTAYADMRARHEPFSTADLTP